MPSWVTNNMLAFIIFLALVAGAAFFGGPWNNTEWYRSLRKPEWTPPAWLFPPMWFLLYALIAIAGFVIWITPHGSRAWLLGLWRVHLVLNGLWSFIFFVRREIALALADIVALWLAIAAFNVLAWAVT